MKPLSGKIAAGTTIVSCSPACGSEAAALTLSQPAEGNASGQILTSEGPEPFAAGQLLFGKGIPQGARIATAEAGALTLSGAATETKANAEFSAVGCPEPEQACTLPVSGLVSARDAEFDTASPDGERAIFTADLGDSAVKPGLYEFDAAAAIAGEPEAAKLIASNVLGYMGASDDATRVYFASNEDLTAGEEEPANPEGDLPVEGKPNLYLYDANKPEGERFAFLGVLSAQDVEGSQRRRWHWRSRLAPAGGPTQQTARVSPDGRHAAFIDGRRRSTRLRQPRRGLGRSRRRGLPL